MRIYEFHRTWNYMRLVAVILGAILTIGLAIKAHSASLEMDYRGPGGEMDRAEREYRDRDNERANDRVNENDRNGKESSSSDRDRANEYQRSNGV